LGPQLSKIISRPRSATTTQPPRAFPMGQRAYYHQHQRPNKEARRELPGVIVAYRNGAASAPDDVAGRGSDSAGGNNKARPAWVGSGQGLIVSVQRQHRRQKTLIESGRRTHQGHWGACLLQGRPLPASIGVPSLDRQHGDQPRCVHDGRSSEFASWGVALVVEGDLLVPAENIKGHGHSHEGLFRDVLSIVRQPFAVHVSDWVQGLNTCPYGDQPATRLRGRRRASS